MLKWEEACANPAMDGNRPRFHVGDLKSDQMFADLSRSIDLNTLCSQCGRERSRSRKSQNGVFVRLEILQRTYPCRGD